jgi:MFS transporter, ACS family, hexuronate transporter
LLSYRQTWAFSIAKFLTDPIWWFYLFWLPSYFSVKFNLNLSHLGLPLIIVYNVSAIGSIGGGWLPAPFRRLGLSPNYARLAAMLFCAAWSFPSFAASEPQVGMGRHRAAQRGSGRTPGLVGQSLHHIIGHVSAQRGGRGGRHRWHGRIVGGALFAFFAGHILQLTHSYASLFGIAASAYLLALLILYLLAPGLRKVELTA